MVPAWPSGKIVKKLDFVTEKLGWSSFLYCIEPAVDIVTVRTDARVCTMCF